MTYIPRENRQLHNLESYLFDICKKSWEGRLNKKVRKIDINSDQNIPDLPVFKSIKIFVHQADAPESEIAEFLAELSLLYRMMGGEGINFELDALLKYKKEFAW